MRFYSFNMFHGQKKAKTQTSAKIVKSPVSISSMVVATTSSPGPLLLSSTPVSLAKASIFSNPITKDVLL